MNNFIYLFTRQRLEPPRCVNFNYSLKNIPIPSANTYKKRLIKKVECVIKRMRWKAFFFLTNGDDLEEGHPMEETLEFKSRKCPPQIDDLKPFEEDLIRLIENIKFKCLQSVLGHPQQRHKKDKELQRNAHPR